MALPAQTSVLRRVIVGVALLGVLVVTHLGLQQASGFANGCSGFAGVAFSAADIGAEEAGCAAAASSEWASVFGVSNIVWGLLFYGLVTVLRLVYAGTGDNRYRLASAGVVGVGVLYSAFLVYIQAFEIGSFCALCMTSAALALALFILHMLEHRRLQTGLVEAPRPKGKVERRGVAALRPYVPLLGLFVVLLGADLALASRAADGAEPDAPAAEAAALLPTATPRPADTGGACTYAADIEPIGDLSPFLNGPSKGNPDAGVTVVEVLDPNCPHCKDLGEVLHGVIEEQGDNARFYFQPFPLRENSFGQVAALYIAEEQGRFFEMMDALFERQNPAVWGMTLDQIVAAGEDAGLDGASLRARLEDEGGLQPVIARILADRVATVEALSTEQGISVPKLLINGDLVAPTMTSYSADCLTYFIEEAAGGGVSE